METDEKMVVVARYGDVHRADFALSVLAGHEIDGYIDVPYTANLLPHFIASGVALYVRESDAERATAILNNAGAVLNEPAEEQNDT